MTGLGCALSQAALRSPSKTITYPVQNNIYLNSRRRNSPSMPFFTSIFFTVLPAFRTY